MSCFFCTVSAEKWHGSVAIFFFLAKKHGTRARRGSAKPFHPPIQRGPCRLAREPGEVKQIKFGGQAAPASRSVCQLTTRRDSFPLFNQHRAVPRGKASIPQRSPLSNNSRDAPGQERKRYLPGATLYPLNAQASPSTSGKQQNDRGCCAAACTRTRRKVASFWSVRLESGGVYGEPLIADAFPKDSEKSRKTVHNYCPLKSQVFA